MQHVPTAITLTVAGLAEYVDGELQHVAPCTSGDVVHTIIDPVEQLGTTNRPPRAGHQSAAVV